MNTQPYHYGLPMDPPRSYDNARSSYDNGRSGYVLKVWQQPERARLCSYKEENDTVDRRPVDPPPVVEMQKTHGDLSLVETSSFFIRASIVHSTPNISSSSYNHQPHLNDYLPVKTPTGVDATAGESVQTPEQLKGLDNKSGAVVVFAKLSVRIPGIFRLKFTLYEISEYGMSEITSTISEPFEVFSPKLFKGMKESTPLTRHLASQGLKIKLRTDTSIGRQAESRQRAPVVHSPSPPPLSPVRPSVPPPMPYRPMLPAPHPALVHTHSDPRSLVWRPGLPYEPRIDTGPTIGVHYPSEMLPPSHYDNGGDDGSSNPISQLVSKIDHRAPPSSDLSSFSLSHSHGSNSPNQHSTPNASRHDSYRDSTRSASETVMGAQSPTGTARPPNNLSHGLLNRMHIGTGDDGSAMLPAPLPMNGFSFTPHPRLHSLSSKSDSGESSANLSGGSGSRSVEGGFHSGESQERHRHTSPPVKLAPLRGDYKD